jgi:hypothetical protein
VSFGYRGLLETVPYEPTLGYYVATRQGFGDARATEVLFGLEIDALPFIFAWGALGRLK